MLPLILSLLTSNHHAPHTLPGNLQGKYRTEVVSKADPSVQSSDWLISKPVAQSKLLIQSDKRVGNNRLVLANGLISRTFFVGENLACISMKRLGLNTEFVRAVGPEVRLSIDKVWYEVGGLKGQPENSYLLEEWLPSLKSAPSAYQYVGFETSAPEERYHWEQKFHSRPANWPPAGVRLTFHFLAPSNSPVAGTSVDVHYEMYDGMPILEKSFTFHNRSSRPLTVDSIEGEHLAVAQDQVSRLHAESDFSFAMANNNPEGSGLIHFQSSVMSKYMYGMGTTRWIVDPEYNTWATHNQAEDNFLSRPHHCLLISSPNSGPARKIEPASEFRSMRTFELLQDSDDQERKTLGHRRLYRILAPQVTENLLCGSITSQDPKQLKSFIDQMGELGFERLDINPWPGISHTNLDPEYLAKWKGIADYAREKGIVMGGYELTVASRSWGADVDVISPDTLKPGSIFGQSVCIASKWYDSYFGSLWKFLDATGFRTWNADGPYHGDACASTVHKYHSGLEDSQWQQWSQMVSVIHELQRRNNYVPLPDWYFLNGQCVTGMGYREASATLSPAQQLLLGRQYIYDGTWHKIPTMGWLTLQLVGFYSNDPKVGLEPLQQNIDRYERGLVQHLGAGCQFSVRGNRLYDTEATKAMVTKWVSWFKKYRDVLTGDIIHVSRPTGRDLDCIMHVNPGGQHKGMAIVFNPTNTAIKRTLSLPLYYAGLSGKATAHAMDTPGRPIRLDANQIAHIAVNIPANGFTWVEFE